MNTKIVGTLVTGCVVIAAPLGVLAVDAAYGSAEYAPTADRPLGWRGDGTGLFPGAQPPTTWDVANGKNVIWKIPRRTSAGLPS